MDRSSPRLACYVLACFVLAFTAACSPVSHVQIRDDFDRVDRTATYRVHLVTAPLPASKTAPKGAAQLGALYGAIATRYVNQHRDFIVRKQSAQATATQADCGERIEAVLWLAPTAVVKGGDVRVRVAGQLRRCKGWTRIWSAEVREVWPSRDDQLLELTKRYVSQRGAIAEIHAGPAFRALRLLLDTLPRPKLIKEADIDEKIEL